MIIRAAQILFLLAASTEYPNEWSWLIRGLCASVFVSLIVREARKRED